ncbi:MAG: phosphodiester glycosidase family protein, partial [Armatimonadetes bacterium]|nr:phosphodiester glycosidase family protein [Armatimonadota bacterium]
GSQSASRGPWADGRWQTVDHRTYDRGDTLHERRTLASIAVREGALAGRIACDPAGEGFTDPKITSDYVGPRSMVGLTAEGRLLLATSSGTVRQMAQLMLGLGATEAMCMDGGASSGLWAEGRYLTVPGRPISNALLILKAAPEDAMTPDSLASPLPIESATPEEPAKPSPTPFSFPMPF